MPSEQKSINSNPLLVEMVASYASGNGLKSWSAAATSLLVRGIVAWIEDDDCDRPYNEDWPDPHSVAALKNEYEKWRSEIWKEHGWTESQDLNWEDKEYTSLSRYLTEKLLPKHGGKRDGAGRKKDTSSTL